MIESKKQRAWFGFAGWVLLSTASILIGFLLLRILLDPTGGKGNPVTSSVIAVIGLGLLLPIAQWIIIRQFLSKAYYWLVASLAGLSLALALDVALNSFGFYPIQATSTVGMSIVFGLIVGTAQWIYLRQYVPNAAVWIIASVVGWGLMTVATGRVIEGFPERVLFGLIPALCTGLALVYFLYASSPEPSGGRAIAA